MQTLSVIKFWESSKSLNYLVNETPYSAFIFIIKKFVKNREVHEPSEVAQNVDDLALSDVVLRQENIALRQNFKDLESDKCQPKLNIEELEINVKQSGYFYQ